MEFKVGKYTLDEEQSACVTEDAKHVLVVAGAGSGKTLTILGKIYYLINYLKIKPEEIIGVSFTKASALSLKEKIKKEFALDMSVYTFHKLALEILKDNNYEIASDELLVDIIIKFLKIDILDNKVLLNKVLKYFNLKDIKAYKKFWITNYKEISILINLISTFISLFKCNSYELKDFLKFQKQIKKITNFNYFKEKTLLILILNCYITYENYKKENNEIDFNDMLILATKYVKENGFKRPLKYLIIDEYQDTSLVRFNLVREILEKSNASLMVVGDDFQSIYRFTGCELSLFLNFTDYFSDTKILKIQNTYRNSKELIEVAGNFVMKNKEQMVKELKSSKSLDKPIEIVYYEKEKKLKELILEIYNKTKHEIMILGRNNKDIDKFINKEFKLEGDKLIFLSNPEIDITYLTVHKSKGLESEEVILINLTDDIIGFPSKLKDADILRLVSLNKSKFLYDEERRLFYVALTRTKNKVYLLTPKKNPSIFVKELIKDYKSRINIR